MEILKYFDIYIRIWCYMILEYSQIPAVAANRAFYQSPETHGLALLEEFAWNM